ncbi:MAG: hypothetical protein GY715_17590 [Planctomycetes bacterium]|nr:hypothetical protein [Planctomycetota bacterium]
MTHREPGHRSRRGAAVVATIVALVVLNLVVVTMVFASGRDQDLSVRRLETVQAFYAAEAGMNMAIRETITGAGDEDGDGLAGTVSDDADDNTDPTVGWGRVAVVQTASGTRFTVTSRGRAGSARREIRLTIDY